MTDARRRRRGPRRVPRRYPSPAKREIAARRPTPDTAPMRPSTHFGPLLTHPGGSAADRPHHAHRTCKRRRPDARTHPSPSNSPLAPARTRRAMRAGRAEAAILGIRASAPSNAQSSTRNSQTLMSRGNTCFSAHYLQASLAALFLRASSSPRTRLFTATSTA